MKSYDSRTYSINDFVEWERNRQLELNPRFQRRSVWTDKAKSYLMDTILRGKPIPKLFIRQKINTSTKSSVREVVDGQQRLRTILTYIRDGFVVSRRHNPDHGGVRFSQLPEDVQAQLLSYEVSVDLLINLPDAEVLDIFSRLNSYAVILNEQEKINADHFGPFKVLADHLGRKYYDYWMAQGVFTAKNLLRMLEVNLVADLLIAMREGIKGKKQVKKYYDRYEEQFEQDVTEMESRFDRVVALISKVYPEGLTDTEYRRPLLYYTLFTAVAHCEYGIPQLKATAPKLTEDNAEGARSHLDRVTELFSVTDLSLLNQTEQQFMKDCTRATTDEAVRIRRTEFVLNLLAEGSAGAAADNTH